MRRKTCAGKQMARIVTGSPCGSRTARALLLASDERQCRSGESGCRKTMSVDGFSPQQEQPFAGYSSDVARRFYAVVSWVSRHLHVEYAGLENLPARRALLVANHAFGFDVVFPMSKIWRTTGRIVWALGEHAWWRIPFVRRLAVAVGTVDGTPQNVDRLLANDELVLVLPGGLREALKPRELRYHLLWGSRYGFVSAAIRNGAPIVPLASLGADELFDLVGDAFARGEKWLHRPGIPIPRMSRIVPLPHRVPLRFVLGKPILPGAPADRANDADTLHRVRREVEGALHEIIENELAKRTGVANER